MQTPYEQASTQAYAGVGIRFVALILDGIIIGIIGGILTAIFGAKQIALISSLDVIIYLLYFIILEATMGSTLGKKVLGLRVVREDGAPISWSESIIRNLLRIIDGLFAYLLGAIFIWTSPLKQRLGDKAAHTVVVKAR